MFWIRKNVTPFWKETNCSPTRQKHQWFFIKSLLSDILGLYHVKRFETTGFEYTHFATERTAKRWKVFPCSLFILEIKHKTLCAWQMCKPLHYPDRQVWCKGYQNRKWASVDQFFYSLWTKSLGRGMNPFLPPPNYSSKRR